MTDKQRIDLDAIKQAIEERDAAIGNLEALAQRLEYRGNSVSWWHSKAKSYGDALLESWDALKASGVKCDGKTSVADGIGKLNARLDALLAAAGKVTCQRCDGTGVERWNVFDGTDEGHEEQSDCPDCADLRLLMEKGK